MAITSMEITKKPISIPVTNGSTSQVSRVAKITEVPEALKQMVLTSTEMGSNGDSRAPSTVTCESEGMWEDALQPEA